MPQARLAFAHPPRGASCGERKFTALLLQLGATVTHPSDSPHLVSKLAVGNDVFRGVYADARAAAVREVPIFVVLADEIVLCQDHERRSYGYTPPLFRDLKGAAHVLVALASLLSASTEMSSQAGTKLERLRRGLASAPPPEDADDRESRRPIRAAIGLALDALDRAVNEGRVTRGELADFARSARPILLELTQRAARLKLLALHDRVEEALRRLSAEDRARLHVVVAGDHQARSRSLGVQYFQRRLPERHEEERVIYGESVTSVDEAIALVGTCLVDRVLASNLFGDPQRLQRDVLGDATKTELDRLELSPIA